MINNRYRPQLPGHLSDLHATVVDALAGLPAPVATAIRLKAKYDVWSGSPEGRRSTQADRDARWRGILGDELAQTSGANVRVFR